MKEEKEKAKLQNPETAGFDINSDESQSGTSHLNDPLANEPEIEALRSELNELRDKYLRNVAEFDNFRKRSNKEKYELIRTAGKEVITDLLEVLDDLDRAENQLESSEDTDQIKEGITLVFAKLRSKLSARGLKEMDAINEDFDADLHEAITEIPAGKDELKGKVLDVVQKGYYLNDSIIRHAKVIVGK